MIGLCRGLFTYCDNKNEKKKKSLILRVLKKVVLKVPILPKLKIFRGSAPDPVG